METREAKRYNLGNTTIYICPACGQINPAGPSDGCPHLQLVKFKGVDEDLEDLIMKVAEARRNFGELTASLKKTVSARIQDGSASVENPHSISAHEVDRLYTQAGLSAFSLTSPEKNTYSKKKNKKRKNTRSGKKPETVDPRQLDLLLNSTPRGEA